MTGQIVVFGAGGQGREVVGLIGDLLESPESPSWELLGFVDDDPEKLGKTIGGLKVLGSSEWLMTQEPRPAVAVGLAAPQTKRRVVRRLAQRGFKFPALVHPSAHLGARVRIGDGTVVAAGSIATTDVEVGSFVTINLDSTLSHDVVVKDFVTVAPGAHVAGNVKLEEGAEIGIGATIIQGVRVGQWSVLGAGAVAVKDVPDNVVSVGVPSAIVRELDDGWHED